MVKKPSDYPLFHLRMSQDLQDWLRDYSKRIGKPMSAIIKDYLEELRRKAERARRQEAKS